MYERAATAPAGQSADAATDTCRKRGRPLTAPRVQIRPADRAARRESAHALAATGTDMGSDGFHTTMKQHGRLQLL